MFIGFRRFLRYDDLCNIVPKHIEFHDDYIKIFLPRCKTDIYREGNFIYIGASSSKYCPVGILRRYSNLSGTDSNSTLPLFTPLTFHPSNSSYTLTTGKMSYSRCREIRRDCLSKLGYNPNPLHSLRYGGITSVVRNSNHSVPERLLKR